MGPLIGPIHVEKGGQVSNSWLNKLSWRTEAGPPALQTVPDNYIPLNIRCENTWLEQDIQATIN